jgi:hypothetical protein
MITPRAWPVCALLLGGFLSSRAAVLTVCSSGCTHRTINSAIRAAGCGDQVQIAADETHYGGDGNRSVNNPIVLRYKDCPAGAGVTITTNQDSKLPAADTRITPNYAGPGKRVIPLIMNVASGPIVLTDVGPHPAHDYRLVGLEFCCAARGYSDFIAIGSTENGSNEPLLNALSDLPYNIELDRILVRTDPLDNTRRCVSVDGTNVTIRNSWIECAFDRSSSDSQGISGLHPQRLRIINNYISGTTESLNLSGACSPIRSPKFPGFCGAALSGAQPADVEIAFNEITKPEWMRVSTWSPRTRVQRGKAMLPVKGAVIALQARNAGTTGDTEPVWPAAVGSTVNDGGVVWQVMNGHPAGKNLIEAKAGERIKIHHNFLHNVWPQGQQGYAFTFTSRTNTSSGGGNWSFINDVTIENNVITDAGAGINTTGSDGDGDPNAYASIMPARPPPYRIDPEHNRLLISINGETARLITLTAGPARSAADIIADLRTQLKSGIACVQDDRFLIRASSDGPGSCKYVLNTAAAQKSSIAFLPLANDAYNVLGFTPEKTYRSCTNPRTGAWYGCGRLSGLYVRNNLWANINVAPNLAGIPYVFGLFNRLSDVEFTHNTVDADYTTAMFLLYSESMPHSNVRLLSNIFGFRKDNEHPINAYGTLFDFSAINYMFCNLPVTDTVNPVDSVCPENVVANNIMPGIQSTGATLNTRPFSRNSGYGSYPKNNWNDSWSRLSFRSPGELDYRFVPGGSTARKFAGRGHDGKDVGVDSSVLPLILGLQVKASETQAEISFELTEAIRQWPCVIRVATDPDLIEGIPDLDPSRFLRPDASNNGSNVVDGNKRVMKVGGNVPLRPSTKYFYYLGCAGSSRSGSFVTR